MDKLKLIKSLVAVITFLLVFGGLLLLTLIYKKAHPQAHAYEEQSLQQPQGSSIASVTEADGKLAVLVKGGGEPDRIILYNPKTMQKVITLHLQEKNND